MHSVLFVYNILNPLLISSFTACFHGYCGNAYVNGGVSNGLPLVTAPSGLLLGPPLPVINIPSVAGLSLALLSFGPYG
ncbi:hypothetical protein Tsubulata_046955 [Turnera subulata]|uniref:Uncharacterized protein n=1 Tax=Turnera subulata TaxID=218843 RepID=A0A9Q0F3J1_9ROSI|nr:hypothetical protein Tsubulata_046955 [Turnera subulata]